MSDYDLLKQAGFSDEEILADAGFSPEEIATDLPQPEPGWGETLGANLKSGVGDIVSAGAGLADLVGLDGVAKGIRDIQAPYEAERNAVLSNVPQGSAKQYVGAVTRAVPAIGATLASGVGLLGAAAQQGALGAGLKADQLVKQGVTDDGDIRTASLIKGGVDAALTPLTMGATLSGVAPLKSAMIQGLGGAVQGGASTLADLYGSNLAGKGATADEAKTALLDSLIIGGGTGAATAALGAPAYYKGKASLAQSEANIKAMQSALESSVLRPADPGLADIMSEHNTRLHAMNLADEGQLSRLRDEPYKPVQPIELPKPKTPIQPAGLLTKSEFPQPIKGIQLAEPSSARTPEEIAAARKTIDEVQHGVRMEGPSVVLPGQPTPSEAPIVKPFTEKGKIRSSLAEGDQAIVQEVLQQDKVRQLAEQSGQTPQQLADVEAVQRLNKYIQPIQLGPDGRPITPSEQVGPVIQPADPYQSVRSEPPVAEYTPILLKSVEDYVRLNPHKVAGLESRFVPDAGTVSEARQNQSTFFQRFMSDRGSVRIPGTFSDIAAKITGMFQPDRLPEVESLVGRVERQSDKATRYFEGGIDVNPKKLFGERNYSFHVPGLSQAQAAFRKGFVYSRTLADKFPAFKPIYEAGKRLFENQELNAHDFASKIRPYFDLADSSRVDQYLEASRRAAGGGKEFIETPELMAKAGLTPEDIAAVQSVRDTMEYALNRYGEAQVANGADPKVVADFINEHKTQKFVPFSRFGDRYVKARHPVTGEDWYSFHETKADQVKTIRELHKNGYKIEKDGHGILRPPSKSAYENMSPLLALKSLERNLEPDLVDALKNALPPTGFNKHLARAKLTPGYEKNLKRNIAEYLMGLGNQISYKEFNREFSDAIGKIDTKNPLYEQASNYRKFLTESKSSPLSQKYRKLLTVYYLTNPMTTITNSLQSITATVPEAQMEFGVKGTAIATKAYRKAASYSLNKPEVFVAKYPELADALAQAEAKGITSNQAVKELSARKAGMMNGKKDFADILMTLNSASEKANRVHALITGYDIAVAKGMPHEQAKLFGEEFVRRTQYDYTKANTNALERNLPLLAVFRKFSGSWMRQLRDKLEPQYLPAAGLMLGAMGALGGATAMPFVKDIINLGESLGYDPKNTFRRFMGKAQSAADAIMHGPLSLLGFDISKNAGTGQYTPDVEMDPSTAMLRFLAGVAGDPVRRTYEAALLLKKDENWLAAEKIAPPALRNLSRAARMAVDNGLRLADGTMVGKNPSVGDMLAQSIGLSNIETTREFEKRHSQRLLEKLAKNNDDINNRIAKAMSRGDNAEVSRLFQQIQIDNQGKDSYEQIQPSKAAIKQALIKMQNPDLAAQREMPKKARGELQRRMQVFER